MRDFPCALRGDGCLEHVHFAIAIDPQAHLFFRPCPPSENLPKLFFAPCFSIAQTAASRGANRPHGRARFPSLHKQCRAPAKSRTYTGGEWTYEPLIGRVGKGRILRGYFGLLRCCSFREGR